MTDGATEGSRICKEADEKRTMTNYTLKSLKERVLNSDSREIPFLIAELIDYILGLEQEKEQ